MSGKSTQTQTSSQQSEPWAPAQPLLHNILNQLNARPGQLGGLSENEAVALSSLTSNAQAGNPYAPAIGDFATSLLSGGNATAQAPNIQSNLQEYRSSLLPFASGSMVGNNSALQTQLGTVANDIQNRINSMFAGAGRDLSGINQKAVARGIAEGTAPILANQYNQDVANQFNAANSLYGAGNTTAGLLGTLGQLDLQNRGAGINAAGSALDANNYGARSLLEAEALRRNIPIQSLGLLAQIGIPIAGLGGQQQGTATGTNQMSGAQQFATIAGGLNNFGKFLWG